MDATHAALGMNSSRWFPLCGYRNVELLAGDRSEPNDLSHGGKSKLSNLIEEEDVRRRKQILDLYSTHRPSLFRYLRTLGLVADEVEDTIQEAFVRLAAHLANDEEKQSHQNLRSWLFQVSYNLSMDKHRLQRRDEAYRNSLSEIADDPVDRKGNPERYFIEHETMQRFQAAMAKLTPKQRNSILLRAEGLRYEEIGTVLGVTTSRAIFLAKRGMQKIKLIGGL